eukprot:TRINITY_DN3287_c0_g1_i1.p2 TRINITY_DN3287_c0_g1~~TRINITY_DN3287_c0_g1_i1.p2  ORF type:complete len:106 (+),score=14.14 TRINITY_DN3287_c0_g1_i1:464-781(+)
MEANSVSEIALGDPEAIRSVIFGNFRSVESELTASSDKTPVSKFPKRTSFRTNSVSSYSLGSSTSGSVRPPKFDLPSDDSPEKSLIQRWKLNRTRRQQQLNVRRC